MIKAAVVDDERLVRKGFISFIDWAAFGVVIVGEAGDGREALKLLESQDIDLLFVDISMPGMSGFELIRHIRLLYPHTRSVVLTCHHEFDYVQEALRLGAVDYIVKTLLEAENADETIGRLVERLKWEDSIRHTSPRGEAERITTDKALVFASLSPDEGVEKLIRLAFMKNISILTLGDMWISPLNPSFSLEEARRELQAAHYGQWLVAQISGLRNVAFRELEEECAAKLRQAVFYSLDGHAAISCLPYTELKSTASEAAKPSCADALEGVQELRWTLDQTEWEKLMTSFHQQKPHYTRFSACGRQLLQVWSPFLLQPDEQLSLEQGLSENRSLRQWKNWLRGFADISARRMIELGFTKEVMTCMFRAVRYMAEYAGQKINQNDVATSIGMSRGYFSHCYARFAGIPFGESLRNMRIERAKRWLKETDLAVGEVAFRSGFEDERYFSRLFRERIGVLPSEYRAGRDNHREKP
ncbi:response regulator transcription factor [Gorillibacterium timonense]|uniref:response regulator transcription factor n=1 Tax=Gorillibacterium timonense TaxID=1689269 RepID=UPI00071C70BE|nr:response regulator [Gorillibacterium timonense]